ncbi:MAG: hypothetical protein IPJ66_17300 [Bacteroidetes bacterium]|nr:hypothetical protein [Bacteroidota bacterium]
MKTDNLGNIFLAGKSQRSSSQFSQLIAKYNSSGVYQWSDNWWKGIGAGNSSEIQLHLISPEIY